MNLNETALVTMLEAAFDELNAELFNGELPLVVITLHRHRNAAGYFAPQRYSRIDRDEHTHEIALNPDTFKTHRDREILSTLAHEMAHLWQEEKGTPPRRCYHDKQWAAKMKDIGLKPVNVDNPKRETGQRCVHEIIEGGVFDQAAKRIMANGFHIAFHSQTFGQSLSGVAGGEEGDVEAKSKKTKVAYVCPSCESKVWGKPGLNIRCGECDEKMEGDE